MTLLELDDDSSRSFSSICPLGSNLSLFLIYSADKELDLLLPVLPVLTFDKSLLTLSLKSDSVEDAGSNCDCIETPKLIPAIAPSPFF